MPTVKGETGAYHTNNSSNPFSLTLPGGLQVGDPLGMCLVGVSTGLAFSPVPTGWTSVSTGNISTGSYVLTRRTGGSAGR